MALTVCWGLPSWAPNVDSLICPTACEACATVLTLQIGETEDIEANEKLYYLLGPSKVCASQCVLSCPLVLTLTTPNPGAAADFTPSSRCDTLAKIP